MRKRSVSICSNNSTEYLEREELIQISENTRKARKISSSKVLIPIKNEENDYNELTDSINNLNDGFKKSDIEGFSKFLLSYLKETGGKSNSKELFLHSCQKNLPRSLTQSCLINFNPHAAISDLANSDEYEIYKNKDSSNPLNKFIYENTEIKDEILKIMWIGASKIGKTRIINHFLNNREEIEISQYKGNEYLPTIGMEIKKVYVNLFGKNVKIEFYDTNTSIHEQEVTRIYYNIVNAFFYLVVDNINESLEYVVNTHSQVHQHNKHDTPYYLFFLMKSKENKENNSFLFKVKNFCEMNNIHVITCIESELHKKSDVVNIIFNNIFIKKSRFPKNKTKKHKIHKNQEYLKNSDEINHLSSFSSYIMSDIQDPFLEDKNTRKSSFSQKMKNFETNF